MPRRPDINAAVEHIGRYAGRDEWTGHRREHLATMLGRIPEHFGLDLEGLFDEVGRLGHLSSMVAFINESFLAAEYGPDHAECRPATTCDAGAGRKRCAGVSTSRPSARLHPSFTRSAT